MKTPKKMNVRLLRRIEKQILKEPKQFRMDWWYTRGDKIPNCGTAACIAGWAFALSIKKNPEQASCKVSAPKLKAEAALGLTDDQGRRLFISACWPLKFRRFSENNPKQAVARIEHFIKTEGRE